MEEQLISFETAKLAKEKGFDIPCWNYIDIYNTEDSIMGYIGDTFEEKLNFAKEFIQYYLPTQSQLQKWVREVHNIDAFCDCLGSKKYYSIVYDNSIKVGNDKVFEQEKDTSYEKALEIGLQEALKLITNFVN